MHHKGRNRHHWEYWTDLNAQTKTYQPVPMPKKYLESSNEARLVHPQTLKELRFLLTMLKDSGEAETFRYIKSCLRTGADFCPVLETAAAAK